MAITENDLKEEWESSPFAREDAIVGYVEARNNIYETMLHEEQARAGLEHITISLYVPESPYQLPMPITGKRISKTEYEINVGNQLELRRRIRLCIGKIKYTIFDKRVPNPIRKYYNKAVDHLLVRIYARR